MEDWPFSGEWRTELSSELLVCSSGGEAWAWDGDGRPLWPDLLKQVAPECSG
jgi:hypothetical protein